MACNRLSHKARWLSVTPAPGQATVMPWRTAAGVLGMARTIAAVSSTSERMPPMVRPAMIDRNTALPA